MVQREKIMPIWRGYPLGLGRSGRRAIWVQRRSEFLKFGFVNDLLHFGTRAPKPSKWLISTYFWFWRLWVWKKWLQKVHLQGDFGGASGTVGMGAVQRF